MIDYVVQHECELYEFPAWVGGRTTLDALCEHQEAYEFAENYIEDVISVTDPAEVTDTFINDLLWFDIPDVLEEAGFDPDIFERVTE